MNDYDGKITNRFSILIKLHDEHLHDQQISCVISLLQQFASNYSVLINK